MERAISSLLLLTVREAFELISFSKNGFDRRLSVETIEHYPGRW
jgi:hypothetical protein